MKLMEHDTKIVDYLKFDSTLCREPSIDVGRCPTLGEIDKMPI